MLKKLALIALFSAMAIPAHAYSGQPLAQDAPRASYFISGMETPEQMAVFGAYYDAWYFYLGGCGSQT